MDESATPSSDTSNWSSPQGITIIVLVVFLALTIFFFAFYAAYLGPKYQFGENESTSSGLAFQAEPIAEVQPIVPPNPNMTVGGSLMSYGPQLLHGVTQVNTGIVFPTINADGASPAVLDFYNENLVIDIPYVSNFKPPSDGTIQCSFNRLGNQVAVSLASISGTAKDRLLEIKIGPLPEDYQSPVIKSQTIGIIEFETTKIERQPLLAEFDKEGFLNLSAEYKGINVDEMPIKVQIHSCSMFYLLKITV